MDLRGAGGSPTVEVPSASGDLPPWSKVGIIAAIGFVVGVAWPRLAGVRLGPSVPEASSAAAVSSAEPGAPAAPSAAPAAVLAPAASVAVAPAAPAPAVVTPSRGAVFACKTSDGESLHGTECGTLPGLDTVVVSRLRKLSDCPAAAGATGTLHLVLRVDMDRGVAVELGHARGTSAPEALLACARTDLAGTNVAGIAHDRPRYSVAYTVTFASAAGADPSAAAVAANAPPAAATTVSASAPVANAPASRDPSPSSAQVEWEAAIVRDVPKTGKIVARLPRGTAVRIGSAKDGWYPVKYGDGFASDGWVYRGAIGR